MRRTSILKILRIALIAVVVVAAASWLWLRSVEPRQWARMETRVAELTAQLDAAFGPHPVLHGTPIPGNAWDDYRRALDLVSSFSDLGSIYRYPAYEVDADRDAALEAVTNYGSAIEAMRRGTRRSAIRRIRVHENQPLFRLDTDSPLDHAGRLAMLASSRARLLAEDDRSDEAIDLLVDLCRFGLDAEGDGSTIATLVGLSVVSYAVNGMKELLTAGQLSVDACHRLESDLDRLDALFPGPERAVLGELERFGKMILNNRLIPEVTNNGPLPPEALPSWRHGFSQRLQLATAFHRADMATPDLLKSLTGTYAGEQAHLEIFRADLGNPKTFSFAQVFGHMLMDGIRPRRERIARIRLLRMASRYLATGDFLELDDPFGEKLGHELGTDRLRLWSIGENGKHDGKGLWSGSRREDIVLQVPRRR